MEGSDSMSMEYRIIKKLIATVFVFRREDVQHTYRSIQEAIFDQERPHL